MNGTYWAILAGMCVAAGCMAVFFSKKLLIDKSGRWLQLIPLLLLTGLSAVLIATDVDPLTMFLCAGLPIVVALLVRYPNLRVWYSLSWRSADRWRAKDAQRVIDFFTRRGWPVELGSDVYPKPSAHNDGHGMFEIFVSFMMPDNEQYGRVWYTDNYSEWASIMLMLRLASKDEAQLRTCVQQGCRLSVRVEDDRVLGESRTGEVTHLHK